MKCEAEDDCLRPAVIQFEDGNGNTYMVCEECSEVLEYCFIYYGGIE